MPGREPASPLTWLMPLGTLVQFMLPRWAVRPVARLAGWAVFRFDRTRRERLLANLARVLGPAASESDVRRTALAAFRNLAMNYVDLLRLPVMRRRAAAIAEFDSRWLDAAMAGDRGVVLATAHLGNWDLGGVFLSAREVPISAVVEPIPRGWTATVNRYRGALAMETIPIPDHRAIGRALERRRLLVLVADRDLTGRGIVLPAFGARRSYPRGPAVYALRYGTPVVVGCFVSQDRPGRPPYVATVEPPIEFTPSGDFDTDVPALTGIIARRLNALIARYPDQWLVFNAGWQ